MSQPCISSAALQCGDVPGTFLAGGTHRVLVNVSDILTFSLGRHP